VRQVGANIIAMYPSTSLFMAVGQLAIVVLVLFSYPLQVLPCRNSLDKVFHSGTGVASDELDNADEDNSSEMAPLKHTILTTGIVSAGFGIAYFVNDLQIGKYCQTYSLRSALTIFHRDKCSSFLRWIHGVHDGLLYPSWIVLLEGVSVEFENAHVLNGIIPIAY
jgi:hypothetical protein